MMRLSTNMDYQRASFVESLYSSMRKQARKVVEDQERFISLASSYLEDGLEESECIELLMIDGLEREAAENYTSIAKTNEISEESGLYEYGFQFEDIYGKLYTSFDMGKTIRAANDDDAWVKTEEVVFSDPSVEPERIVSVNRIG